MSSVTAKQLTTKSIHWLQAAGNTAVLVLWLWLYRPVFDYLALIFSREDFRTNQILLLGVLFLIATQVRKGGLRLRLDGAPHLAPLPLTLALGGSVLYLLVERFLDVNTISASLFGLASYGLLGLWLEPGRWRHGVPAILLLIGVLPFGDHMQTFIGYPMRILTAGIIGDGLRAAGVASIGVDTILVFENGVSQIDLPCSGVKSLWTGMLFLIAATWVEERPLTKRWFIIAILFAGLLFIANLARVAILVTIGEVLGWRLAAEMLHVPLGVLGFAAACAAAVWMLRRRVERFGKSFPLDLPNRPTSSNWLTPALTAVIVIMGLLYTPRPQTGLTRPSPTFTFPNEVIIEPLPLKPDEFEWLTRDGAESAERMRFEYRGISGSMILITSRTWRGQHKPERCFEVYGLSLDGSRTYLVAPDFPLRFVSLGDGSQRNLYSASYWFQSPSQTTDDFGARIWSDLAPQRETWVLVSILFDGVVDPHDEDVAAFYRAVHQAVSNSAFQQFSISGLYLLADKLTS
jgi:exosortase O